MSFCQIGIIATTNQAHSLQIYGTNSFGEISQRVTGFVNTKILTMQSAASACVVIPTGIFPELDTHGSFSNLTMGDITVEEAGGDHDSKTPHLINMYLHMTGNKGMAPGNQASTDETDSYEHYYANDGSTAGSSLSWLAVPCGTFDFIQLRAVSGAAGIMTPIYCLYS
tara:strand:- start:939 stop:1442 length:504 start_codon:yes stop_codon:yes gene_type:complete